MRKISQDRIILGVLLIGGLCLLVPPATFVGLRRSFPPDVGKGRRQATLKEWRVGQQAFNPVSFDETVSLLPNGSIGNSAGSGYTSWTAKKRGEIVLKPRTGSEVPLYYNGLYYQAYLMHGDSRVPYQLQLALR